MPTTPTLRFVERMSGFIAPPAAGGDYQAAYDAGQAAGTSIQFTTTTTHDDLPALLEDPASPATVSGTLLAPLLCPSPLTIVSGRFVLLERQPQRVETDWMRYSFQLQCEGDPTKRYRLEGHKVIDVGSMFTAWRHTTTLYVDVYQDSPSGEGAKVALGVLHIGLPDVYHLISTAEVLGAQPHQAEAYRARFAFMFIRSIWPMYGGALDELARFSGPARPRSPTTGIPGTPDAIRLCDPSGTWHSAAKDPAPVIPDACSRLIRYRGGDKGPLVMATGFAMSATSLHSVVGPGLADSLVEAGFDVWLFDYRGGIDLPSSDSQFTIDDIARTDWPRAVSEVLRQTGADSVQAFGHCVGSVSLLMAMLQPDQCLRGKVRSLVCSQFTLHPRAPRLKRVESEIHLGSVLQHLHLRRLRPDTARTVPDIAEDLALHVVPVPKGEACTLSVCRWLNFVFGLTHAHDQLDDATHRQLPDLFGAANLRALTHLGLMMQRGKAVDAAGRNVYVCSPQLLADLPIHFLAGRRNYIFHPEGTDATMAWLAQGGGGQLHTATEFDEYAHLDSLIGRHAARDVFPDVLAHLEPYA